MKSLILPQGYKSKLNLVETEKAIKLIKDTFEKELSDKLNLDRISSPLFVKSNMGLNDDLNGVERAVKFDIKDLNKDVEIIHSLAKWKRYTLKRYGFPEGLGIYTDMNAIRRDETLDNLHSVYVDQWDWEKIISKEDRTNLYLEKTVKKIIEALKLTQKKLISEFKTLSFNIPDEIFFIASQELEYLYPDLTPHEREIEITKKHKLVFISQIGGKLKSGVPHDGRAPDYDDWNLNGDILIWYPLLNTSIEISSMGIRVDEASLSNQLSISGLECRKNLEFHRMLLNSELPITIGGGIGQSRICMILLEKAHIGEVQASVWPDEMVKSCGYNEIYLL